MKRRTDASHRPLSLAMEASATFVSAAFVASELHEQAHGAVAVLLGYTPNARSFGVRVTEVPKISKSSRHQASIVRHSGWIASVALTCSVHVLGASWAVIAAFILVALEAIVSDLLCLGRYRDAGDRFFCGNFGLLLLDATHADKVLPALEKMLRVTCMRGAQSAGEPTHPAWPHRLRPASCVEAVEACEQLHVSLSEIERERLKNFPPTFSPDPLHLSGMPQASSHT